jgi:hypothetical protein
MKDWSRSLKVLAAPTREFLVDSGEGVFLLTAAVGSGLQANMGRRPALRMLWECLSKH